MSELEKQTILLVDDTSENIDVLEGILGNDYNLKVAVNGKVAVFIAKKFIPDLILLDIMMPVMDGFEACKILKNDPITKNIPIMFVTAMDQDYDEAKGFNLGVVDYITKPISPIVVKARVETHLALHDQQKELTKQVIEATEDLRNNQLEVIHKLSIAAEFKDNDTGQHVARMSRYCYEIAKSYGINEKGSILLMNASPMHDVGKIGIPDSILQKPGRLDKDEFDVIKTHCEIGKRIIGESKSELLNAASLVAYQHHEKYNGKGYPQGLAKDDIHVYAKITSVADVFDALTSERTYKKAWELDRAINLIKEESGQQFDPIVVKAFVNVIDIITEIRNEYQ